MKTYTFENYLIVLTRCAWGYDGAAIPDHGETVRRKLIGYSESEMVRIMREEITRATMRD